MRGHVKINRRAFLAGCAPLAASLTWVGHAAADPSLVLVAVVSRSSGVHDISLGALRRIFLGETVDGPTGMRFVGFNHPPKTRPRVTFDSLVLGMGPDEVARYWVDQRIRGGARPPRTVASIELLRQVIAQLPGAISYLPSSELDQSVRALTIGGIPADSARYPLR
jgi:hypothetical protein